MTALWIGLGVIVALLVTWRLRRAARVLDLIVSEELERPDLEVPQAESRNQ
jgi:hypothetical protein